MSNESIDALRDADRRPLPPTDAARARIEARMMAAYDEADWVDPEHGSSATLIDLGRNKPGERNDRSHNRGRRLLVAAAAIAAIATATAIGLVANRDDPMNVAGVDKKEMNTRVVVAVRTWCPVGLSDLRTALVATDDDIARRGALDELAAAAESLFDLLEVLKEPDGLRRLDEIGRIPGEAALLRDGVERVERGGVETLRLQLQAELDLTSDSADECRISP